MARILAIGLLFVSIITHSANAELQPERDGRMALQFTFNSLSLGTIDGGIGGKYWLSDHWALRGGFTVRVDDRDQSSDDEINDRTRFDERKNFGFGGGLGVERHIGTARLVPYFGAMFRYDYREDDDTSRSRFGTESRTFIFHQKTRSIGAELIFGGEYWFTKRFALSGEYALQGRHSYSEGEGSDEDGNKELQESDTISFGFDRATLLLSIYF